MMHVPNTSPIYPVYDDESHKSLMSLPRTNDADQEYEVLSQSEISSSRDQRETERENDLMHASFMTSTNSAVRVEITDEGRRGSEMSMLAASAILRKCKQQVFRPYSRLLLLIGWRPFGRERFNYHWGWVLLNLVYPVFVMTLLFYTYAYELLACQGKLDVDVPITAIPKLTTTTDIPQNSTHVYDNEFHTTTKLPKDHGMFANCKHIVTSYIVPDFLHFLAFCLGFWYFRIQDNEQMYALIEQVFLLVTPLPRGIQTQTDMIKSLRRILLVGGIWILFTIIIQGVFLAAYGYQDFSLQVPYIPQAWDILLLSIDIVGFLIINCVNTAVVVNYAIQCETILFYGRSIKDQLFEKSSQLQNIMHDLYRVWNAILRLNGVISKMTSLCAFYFAERFVFGAYLLATNRHHDTLVWIYRSLAPISWLFILAIPLSQALRVNATLDELQEVSMEVRVFGYQNNAVNELDSFQQFVSNGKFRVKLMSIPVKASYVYGSLIFIVFVIIILTQTGVLTGKSFF